MNKESGAVTRSAEELNLELQEKLEEIRQKKEQLEENFQHSIRLSYSMLKIFYPLLALQTKGIAELCELMADSGLMSKSDGYLLKTAAWLVNIGFVSVNRKIIDKWQRDPDHLTEAERINLHRHPVYAEELVRDFKQNLKLLGGIIRSAREMWDGSGYPDGKMGEIIPRVSRYLAIAIYYVESQKSAEQTVEDIIDNSGKLFYPDGVRLFLKVSKQVPLPPKVEELVFSELKTGMVLAQGLHNPEGILIFPEGHVISNDVLEKIVSYNDADPLTERILVYRETDKG